MREVLSDSRAIATKEVRQLIRDPVSLALSFLFPLVMMGIFITLFSFQTASYNIPVVVADLDQSTASRELIDQLSRTKVLHLMEVVPSEGKALDLVESGHATVAVVIPNGFSKLLHTGNAFLELARDTSKPSSSSLAQAEVERLARDIAENNQKEPGSLDKGLQIINRSLSGRPSNRDPILPGLLGMIIILGSFDDAVNAIGRERERGTFPRLVLTQASVLSIYAGKTLTTVILTVARTSLMLSILALMGLVVRGNPILIYLTTVLMAVFTLGVGLALSSRIRGSVALTVLEIALAFPLLLLTGATRSPEILAPSGQAIAKLLPWTYGNDALRRVIYLGFGWQAVSQDLLVLTLSSLTLLPIASVLFKRSM